MREEFMATGSQGRILRHGTTRKRAEAIMKNGPDPNFLEPGSFEKVCGFSTAPPQGPYHTGDPKEVAAAKAALFVDEEGPVILEVEVPEEIVALAINQVSEIRFEPGNGLEELRAAWPSLPKRILEL
jgi:hypothetical protein